MDPICDLMEFLLTIVHAPHMYFLKNSDFLHEIGDRGPAELILNPNFKPFINPRLSI